jgi:hypothetical protein
MARICSKCGQSLWGKWTSSKGVIRDYCITCRRLRGKNYNIRLKNATGNHTDKQWKNILSNHDKCPECERFWKDIPLRPDKRYKYVWTKDHIVPLISGGSNDIDNIQPLCYQCNFKKHK